LQDKGLQNILRAAIRYYYDEKDYNPHLGGKLEEILGTTNKIFKVPISKDDICGAAANLISSQNFLRNPSKGVSLFNGHHKYGRGWFDSVKNSSYQDWSMKDIQKRKRWIKSDLRLCIHFLKSGLKLFRGRPGFKKQKYPLVEGEKWFIIRKIPYASKKEMGPPPPSKAVDKRCSKKGKPLFYLASDKQTVISELKQELDTYISVGSFKLDSNIKVANLCSLDYFDFAKNDNLIESYNYLITLQELFMKPVNDKNKEEYKKTQLIAEFIKNLGYKGIIYNSSVSQGKNYVFFTDRNLSFIKSSAKLVKIKNIEYSSKTIINKRRKDPLIGIDFIQEVEV